ncbi:hypothetical protein [Salinibacter ruber]|nr:hypothetical protein [Salinibacter ruber]MCS3661746.1 hypothetical protein [Salinibacter ruber]
MEMPPNSNQESAQNLRNFFSSFDVLRVTELEMTDIEMITGRQLAETILLTVATAKESFEAFREAYEQDIERGDVPRVFSGAYLDMAEEVNMMWGGLSPESEFPLDGKDVIAWMDGRGPEVTEEHLEGLAAFLIGMQKAMAPLRTILVDYARTEDGYDGRVYSQVAWEHYLQGVLSSCDCPYMEKGFEHGVDISGLKDRFEQVFQDIQDESSKAGAYRAGEDAKLGSAIGEEDVSDDLQAMIDETDSLMN